MASAMIDVTQDHIDEARTRECRDCPIELGLAAAGFWYRVNGYGAWEASMLGYTHLPKKCRTFMSRFDTKKSVKPFRFRFNPDRPST